MVSDSSIPRSSGLRLGVVLSGWPRVSETFAINELLALEAAGILGLVVATKPGDNALVQPAAAQLRTPVHLLPEGDLATQSEALVHLAAGRVNALHGYFAHRPAAVAERAAAQLGIPFGFSAHALDVRKVGADELAARCAAARCVVSCNGDTAAVLAAAGGAVQRLAHGVDTAGFPAVALPPARPQIHLLAVGRLVAKKGFGVLIEAVAKVGDRVRLDIVGDGPLRGELESAIELFGLGDRVRLLGRRTHAELPALYRAADIVVVPSIVDANGDRDGLPNVVLEAMASQRPVIASDVAALSSAVRDRDTGLLVAPGDVGALAEAIAELLDDPALRAATAANARALIEHEFDLSLCTTRFIRCLETSYV